MAKQMIFGRVTRHAEGLQVLSGASGTYLPADVLGEDSEVETLPYGESYYFRPMGVSDWSAPYATDRECRKAAKAWK